MKQRRWAPRTTTVAIFLGVLAITFSTVLIYAYNTFEDNLGTVTAPNPVVPRWASLPVTWLLNAATPNSNVSTTGCGSSTATCIRQSLQGGFTAWTSTPIQGKTLTQLTVTNAGLSTLTTPDTDCKNVIGFSDTTSSDFPTGTIAFTQAATVTRPANVAPGSSFTYTCSGGQTGTCDLGSCIADADIEFNPAINFYTTTAPSSGTAFNVQSVATHEEGHMLGLDHSGIGHTIMFPFGDTTAAGQQLALSTDDAVGIADLYPCTAASSVCTDSFSHATGTISGTVSLNGSGAFAAHVVAIDTATGNVVMDTLSSLDGTYNLVGVSPGNYNILALPLAPDFSSGIVALGDFSGWACGYADPADCSSVPQNPTNYTGRYF
jgi:hypothetical protein